MTDQYPILYSFRRCPYAMRARMALYIANQPYILREVDLKDKPQAMLDISPKGTVPVLLYPNGEFLEESADVVKVLVPASDVPVKPMLKLITDEFVPSLVRFKYHDRYEGNDRELEASRLIQSMQNMFLWCSDGLLHQQTDAYTQLDVLLLPLLRQLYKADEVWFADNAPDIIHAYVLNFMQSDMHAVVMQKHPVWVPDQSPVIITR